MTVSKDRLLVPQLKWEQLSNETHDALDHKLEGLYGRQRDSEAFDYLVVDKQQALLMLLRRFRELGIWNTVARIENVYGEGGVGMAFKAWPFLLSSLRQHKSFTSLFAKHHNNSGGFMETNRAIGSLHFCYVDGVERTWEVHFDIYNPWVSPINAWRHLVHEKWRKEAAHWTTIAASFT
jgi:hypothetical protein